MENHGKSTISTGPWVEVRKLLVRLPEDSYHKSAIFLWFPMVSYVLWFPMVSYFTMKNPRFPMVSYVLWFPTSSLVTTSGPLPGHSAVCRSYSAARFYPPRSAWRFPSTKSSFLSKNAEKMLKKMEFNGFLL